MKEFEPAKTEKVPPVEKLNERRSNEELINEIFSMRPAIRNYVRINLEKYFPTVTDEVTDEILEKATLNIHKFKEEISSSHSSLASWVGTIQRNKVIEYARNKKSKPVNNPQGKIDVDTDTGAINQNSRDFAVENLDSGIKIEQDLLKKEEKLF
jgi:DNA-directed RNA polymerase specialized sigma24 family protein